MFKRIVSTACYSGAVAAVLLTLMQALWITPLILKAETYEIAGVTAEHVHEHELDADAQGAGHGVEAWTPKDGWQRTTVTFSANLVVAIGFALILCALYNLRAPSKTWHGLLWGLAGFATFCLMPAAGLPPELPGTVAAELSARQYWWGATALATAVSLALMVLSHHWAWRVLGVSLFVVPHLIGAPQPVEHAALAPEALQAQFQSASILVNGVFWIALGALTGGLFGGNQRSNSGSTAQSY